VRKTNEILEEGFNNISSCCRNVCLKPVTFYRGLYGVDLRLVVEALLGGDDDLPFLTANLVRARISAGEDPNEVIRQEIASAVRDIQVDARVFADEVQDLSRTGVLNSDRRGKARGMMFGDSYGRSQDGFGEGLSYVYSWFNDHMKGFCDFDGLDLRQSVGAVFAVCDKWQAALPCQKLGECVFPTAIPNSAIESVLVSFDFLVKKYLVSSRCFHLVPGDGEVQVFASMAGERVEVRSVSSELGPQLAVWKSVEDMQSWRKMLERNVG
jgi:hypothetical protein